VHYIDNGRQSLVDRLEAAARTAGVRIALKRRATALDDPAIGLRTVSLSNGSTVEADRVIVATPPHQAAHLLNTYPAGQRTVTSWSITPGHVACLDVALKQLPVPEHAVVHDLEQPRFKTAQSVHFEVAPNGSALIYTFKQPDPGRPPTPAPTNGTSKNSSTKRSPAGATCLSTGACSRKSRPSAPCRPRRTAGSPDARRSPCPRTPRCTWPATGPP
jgi:hypothetical protein